MWCDCTISVILRLFRVISVACSSCGLCWGSSVVRSRIVRSCCVSLIQAWSMSSSMSSRILLLAKTCECMEWRSTLCWCYPILASSPGWFFPFISDRENYGLVHTAGVLVRMLVQLLRIWVIVYTCALTPLQCVPCPIWKEKIGLKTRLVLSLWLAAGPVHATDPPLRRTDGSKHPGLCGDQKGRPVSLGIIISYIHVPSRVQMFTLTPGIGEWRNVRQPHCCKVWLFWYPLSFAEIAGDQTVGTPVTSDSASDLALLWGSSAGLHVSGTTGSSDSLFRHSVC